MTASTKPGSHWATALRRRVNDPALSEVLSFPILPEPPSADPHARWCGLSITYKSHHR
jgi:hypothetical protein